MLKILQARLQQYVNWERPDVQAGFRKGRGTRDQIANIHWIIEKAKKLKKKKKKSASLTTPKPLTMWITTNCWKILKEMGIPDRLTCLLRSLYAWQEATVRTGAACLNLGHSLFTRAQWLPTGTVSGSLSFCCLSVCCCLRQLSSSLTYSCTAWCGPFY